MMMQTPQLQFTDQDWERVSRDTMAWWEGELRRPLVWLATTDPLDGPVGYLSQSSAGQSATDFLINLPSKMSAYDIVDSYIPFHAKTRYFGDAFPWWLVQFGPGIAAGFLGAEVHAVEQPTATVWFSPRHRPPIEELSFEYDPESEWLKRVKELTQAIVRRYDGRLAVAHTDLGGNLDIVASFRETERLLFDLVDHPDEVERLVGQITKLWIRYYDQLDDIIRPTCRGTTAWAPIWSTGKTYMLQCDFAYMISPAMFERFVVPDLAACCEHLDHGFYHLDGKGQIPHLDLLLSIPRLRGIQWIPGRGNPSSDHWLDLLKRIRDGGKLCQVYVTPEGALRIARNIGGKGFLFIIWQYGRQFEDPEQAGAFLEALSEQDISQN